PVLRLLTCCPPLPCARLSRARTTTRTPPRPSAISRRRACPPYGWMPHGTGGTRPLPTFTTTRSTSEPPSCTPAASPSLRRSHSRWPPHRHTQPASESPPPAEREGATASRPRSARFRAGWKCYGASGTGSSRTASRLACRTRTVWQYRYVPSLSGPLAASPHISADRLPSASPACCDRLAAGSFHPRPVMWWRLVAHERIFPVDPGAHRLGRLPAGQILRHLEDRHQGQPARRPARLAAFAVGARELLIGQPLTKLITDHHRQRTLPLTPVHRRDGH